MLTVTVKDIEILKRAQQKLYARKRLSDDERYTLTNFLDSLPPAENLLNERFPINEHFEVKVFDIEEMWPQLEKWVSLFNNLPKNSNELSVHAGLISADDLAEMIRKNTIITGSFVPSLAYSKRRKGEIKNIVFDLKTDGTATFQFWMIEDAENFPELYNFNGSWKDAYLLVVETLQNGWPQTRFPKEFEQFLPKSK